MTGLSRRAAWLAVLLFLAAGPAAGDDELPDLEVSPGTGTQGTILTVTGPDFEDEPRSRRVALKAAIGGKRTVVIELTILDWKPDALQVKIPRVGQVQDLEYHVVLLDWTGRTLARAPKPFMLDPPVESGPAPEP